DRAAVLRRFRRLLEGSLIDSGHLPAHLQRRGLHLEPAALLGAELHRAGGLQTARSMTLLREAVRERHAEATCVRRREQLLGRRAARGALGAGLPAQGGITERAAASARLALARHQIAFPLRRRPALHGRSSCCRAVVADVAPTG